MTTTATRPAAFFSAAFGAIAGQLRTARAQRSRRIALMSLLDLDAHSLDDLGINVGDVLDALSARNSRS